MEQLKYNNRIHRRIQRARMDLQRTHLFPNVYCRTQRVRIEQLKYNNRIHRRTQRARMDLK